MKRRHETFALLCAALMLWVLARPASVRGAEQEEIVVIANPGVPIDHASAVMLEALFTLAITTWSNGDRVVPLNQPPLSPVRVAFDAAVLGLAPDLVSRFWLERRIRGQGASPRIAPTSELLVRVVAKLRGSIGYVPASRVTPGVKVLARIRNGEVVGP